jgi:hypothetical protein
VSDEATLGRRKSVGRAGVTRGRAFAVALFEQGSGANRRLTLVLGLIVGAACLLGLRNMIAGFPAGIDFEIPLRAASRWAGGSQAYPPSAMQVQSGPDLPFLYPPFLLPLLAPLAALPRDIVTGTWLILCAACGVWICRRLAIPWVAVPFVLAWPPFSEGLITGNVQIWSFAAFVALLYEPADGALRQRTFVPAQDALNGILAVGVGALKVTQLLPVLYLARRRRRAVLVGIGAMAALVIAMLPLTGTVVYGDWLAQLSRAADPGWAIGGVGIGRRLGLPDLLPVVLGIAVALSIHGRDSAAWLGIALLTAMPGVHGYAFLFLLPGLLTIRRDFSLLLAVLCLGVDDPLARWTCCLLVTCCLVAMHRWKWLRQAARLQSFQAGDWRYSAGALEDGRAKSGSVEGPSGSV